MKKVLTLLCGTVAWAADVTPLNMKLGEWETTTVTESGGGSVIPQDVLDKMPQKQREAMEQAVKSRGMMAPQKNVTKTCMKKEDLAKALSMGDTRGQSCTRTVVSSSTTKQEMKVECTTEQGAKSTGTVKFEALSPESTRGSMQMAITTGRGGPPMNMTINIASKWIGATCSETK